VIEYLVAGLAMGAASGVVPGPCGVTIIDAATRHGLGRAVATATGSGLGDLTYGALGVFGVGHVLRGSRALVDVLLVVSGLVLIGFGVACSRCRPVADARPARPLGGLVVGFVTLVCNPGALVGWSAVVGTRLVDATVVEQLATVLGIGAGSLAWFNGMALMSARGRALVAPHLRRLRQVAGGAFVAVGVVSVARALVER
jgi:threonine/homoserine/homoserine lactone efflux protein